MAVIQTEAADDNLLLALVKPLQNLADLRLRAACWAVSCSYWSAAIVLGARRTSPSGSCGSGRGARCSSGIVRAKFFMIAQLAYVLNLLPRAKSNFSTARISDMLPSLTSSKKLSRLARRAAWRSKPPAAGWPARSGSSVATASSYSVSISSIRLLLARAGSSVLAQLAGLVLQVVELAEQVRFLLARQQRHLVQAGQIRRQPAGKPGLLRRRRSRAAIGQNRPSRRWPARTCGLG